MRHPSIPPPLRYSVRGIANVFASLIVLTSSTLVAKVTANTDVSIDISATPSITTSSTTTTTSCRGGSDASAWCQSHLYSPQICENPTPSVFVEKNSLIEDNKEQQDDANPNGVMFMESTKYGSHSNNDSSSSSLSTEEDDLSAGTNSPSADIQEEEDDNSEEDEYADVDDDDDDDEEEEEDEEDEDSTNRGSSFGVKQLVELGDVNASAVYLKLRETLDYINEFAESVDRFVHLRQPNCWNQDELCTIWAIVGECHANPDYMLQSCGPACQACRAPDTSQPGSAFGVPQALEYEEDVEEDNDEEKPPHFTRDELSLVLTGTEQYMQDEIWTKDFYTKVRRLCFNKDELCTVWAAQGECQLNRSFMIDRCSPACQTCEQLHYETRCPVTEEEFPAIWKPGDLNRLFERLVADPAYNTTVWSRPEQPGDRIVAAAAAEPSLPHVGGPWIITVDNFIEPHEAEHLIQWGARLGYERSEEVGGVDELTGEALDSQISEDRTSTNAWCSGACDSDEIVVRLFERIQNMTGVPPENSEELQLLKYEPDQFYLTHTDYIDGSDLTPGGPRILTVFMYLTDVEQGGETRFDWYDDELLVTPKVGRVAIWPSVLDEDPTQADERTMHEAMPVIQGQKYAANAWLHLRDYQKANDIGC